MTLRRRRAPAIAGQQPAATPALWVGHHISAPVPHEKGLRAVKRHVSDPGVVSVKR